MDQGAVLLASSQWRMLTLKDVDDGDGETKRTV